MLSRFFSLRRQAVVSYSTGAKLSYFRDAFQHGISAASLENVSSRAYAGFCIFKGKAALMVDPLPAKFAMMDSGILRLHKRGVILFKFIPAIGQRKYDGEKKQFFALSATEVGCLIGLGPSESCEFFHDPAMKTSLEGQVKKTLTISPMADSSGFLFNLSVLNVHQKANERFTVPVTKAEFTVMRTACAFVLPHIMGWDRLMEPNLQQSERGLLKQGMLNVNPNIEWER